MPEKHLTGVARKLPHCPTDAEALLWSRLRNRQLLGFKFRRQMPIGNHVADFACQQARLIVEVDGGQHAESANDASRSAAIEAAGYFVLRFWNNDVIENVAGVLEVIAERLVIASGGRSPSPNPLPKERAYLGSAS